MKATLSASILALVLAASASAQYCAASVGTPCAGNEYLSQTNVGSISQSSSCGLGYEDFSAQSTSVTATATLSVQTTITNYFSGDQVDCWVDWDHSGTFDLAEHTTLTLSGSVASATLSVPAAAMLGATRLRLRLDYFPAATGAPCGASSYGNIEDYTVVVTAAPGPSFQLNQPGATFTLDGVAGTSFAAGNVARTADNVACFGTVTVSFASTNTGNPWDLGATSSVAVSGNGPGFTTPGGQFVNVDLNDPSFFFLNGGGFNVPFPGNFIFGFGPGAPYMITGQFVVVDPAQADTVSLANAINYATTLVAAPGPNPAPPVGDDATVTCTFEAACGACAFDFYGTDFTQFSVCTNGRVMPGATTNTSFSPSILSAMAAPGTIGAWTDLNTVTNGNITFSSPAAGVARVSYNAVGFFGGVTGTNGVTMGIEMDCSNGSILMNGIVLATGTGSEFLGISKGAGATNSGPSGPFVGGTGFIAGPPLPTDMVYHFGTQGSGALGGLTSILFTRSVTGGSYDHTQM